MSFDSSKHAVDIAQLANLNKPSGGGGNSGGEQKSIFDEAIFDVIGDKAGLVSKLSGGAVPNFSQAGTSSASLTQPFDSQGLGNIQGLLTMLDSGAASGPFAVIYNALKRLISNREITDGTAGIAAGAEVQAPHIEPMPAAPSMAELFHSAGESIGNFSSMIGNMMHVDTGSSVSPNHMAGGGNSHGGHSVG